MMRFEKYLFGVSLNGWSVAKYVEGEKVIVMAEHAIGDEWPPKTFNSKRGYRAWIDSIVDDATAIFYRTEAVNLTLQALRPSQGV